jgi:hypothetical protein
MLRQDRDFSMIDAIKRQFEDRWKWEKIVLFMWLVPGPNKADNICRKTGTMQRGSTVFKMLTAISTLRYFMHLFFSSHEKKNQQKVNGS